LAKKKKKNLSKNNQKNQKKEKRKKKEKKRPETLDKDSRTLSYFPLPTQAITPDH